MYILSGVIGVAVLTIAFRLVSLTVKESGAHAIAELPSCLRPRSDMSRGGSASRNATECPAPGEPA